MTTLRPLSDRVLLQRLAPVRQQSGSIVIPDSAVQERHEFKVIAVGPGRVLNGVLQPMDVKVGDTVLLGAYAGTNVEVDGQPVFICALEEILAVLS